MIKTSLQKDTAQASLLLLENRNNLQTATFAAGCFWGVEEEFRKVKGVKSTIVGYTGGWFEYPSYKHVCTDRTGHAEAIQIMYDPKEVSYEDLLEVFWSIHNPTTKNRQGFDYGTQYRSAIFYHTPQQEEIARKSKEELEMSGRFKNKRIVTEIVPASTFYKAEEYIIKSITKRKEEEGGATICENICSNNKPAFLYLFYSILPCAFDSN
jgi:peptide-methionine (S)-S-oxide reductase